jgi:lipoate-protein ligase A
MLFVDNGGLDDPYTNLAIEEHLLRNVSLPDPLFFLYSNRPAVITGRNQNIFQEVDPAYLKTNGIHLLRRLSGGGTVYHDLGNLNFAFITKGKEDLHKFAKVTAPIIRALNDLGLDAELKGKSDIFAAGKKISGNAQYASGGRMISHGTLLFNADLKTLGKAIRPRQARIETKAVPSVRSQVVNIRQLLAGESTIQDLKQALLTSVFGVSDVPLYPLSAAEWDEIRDIADSRYRQWEWTYGRTPKFTVQKSIHLPKSLPSGAPEAKPSDEIHSFVEVKGGRIQAIDIRGDHRATDSLTRLVQGLVGLPYDEKKLALALEEIDIDPTYGEPGREALQELLRI